MANPDVDDLARIFGGLEIPHEDALAGIEPDDLELRFTDVEVSRRDPNRGTLKLFSVREPQVHLYSQVVTGYQGKVHKKTLSLLIRGGGEPPILAKSGWATTLDQRGDLYPLLRGSEYTQKALKLCNALNCPLRRYGIDRGIHGQFEASHSEMQLMAWLVEEYFPDLYLDPRPFGPQPRPPFDQVLIISSNELSYGCYATLAGIIKDMTGVTIKIDYRGPTRRRRL